MTGYPRLEEGGFNVYSPLWGEGPGEGIVGTFGHCKVPNRTIACDYTSEELAAAINRQRIGDADLAGVSVCGRFADIYFKATKTLTITDSRWLAYHIELSPRLRKPQVGGIASQPRWPTGFAIIWQPR